MYPHHPSMNNLGGLGAQFQNVSSRFPNQSQPQVPGQDYGFHGNQMPWRGPMQAHYGQQYPDVQDLQMQHQYPLQAQHQHPPDAHRQVTVQPPRPQPVQVEPQGQFPETSYSALLHGPDTPPFQPDPSWDTPATEPENQTAVPGVGSSGYQGLPNNFATEKDPVPEQQMIFYGDPTFYPGGCEPPPPFHPGNQHALLEQSGPNMNIPTKVTDGMTMVPPVHESAQPKVKGNLTAGPKIHSSEQSMPQNPPLKAFYPANSSNDVAANQPRSWVRLDQNWNGPIQRSQTMEGMESSMQSFPNSGQSGIQMQQYPDMGSERGVYGHFHPGSSMPEQGGFKQPQLQDWAMPPGQSGQGTSENELMQYNSWNNYHHQRIHGGYGNHMQIPTDVKYNAWGSNSLQDGTMHVPPNNMQAGWQSGPLSDSTAAGPNFQPYHEGLYPAAAPRARQDPNFTSIPHEFSSSYEQSDGYHASWQGHPNMRHFAGGVEAMHPSYTGERNTREWDSESQPTAMESDALNPMHRMSGLNTCQDSTSRQQLNRIPHPVGNNIRTEQIHSKYIQDPYINQQTANYMKGLSGKPGSSAPSEKGMLSSDKDDYVEGPKAKKQKEYCEGDMGGPVPHRYSTSPQHSKFRIGSSSSLSKMQGVNSSNVKGSSTSSVINKDYNGQVSSDGVPSNSSPFLPRSSVPGEGPSRFAYQHMVGAEDASTIEQVQAMSSMNANVDGNSISVFGPGAVPSGSDSKPILYDRNIQSLQDQSVIPQHQGDRGNLPEIGTSWKSSSPQNNRKLAAYDNLSTEGMESFHATPPNAHSHMTQGMLENQSNIRKAFPGHPVGEGFNSMPHSYGGDFNAQSRLPREHVLASESSSANPLAMHQVQRTLNGFRPGSFQPQFERHDHDQFTPPKGMPPALQVRRVRPPFEMQHPAVQNSPVQLQISKENKSFPGHVNADAWAPRIFESALLSSGKSNENIRRPASSDAKTGTPGKGVLHHPTGDSVHQQSNMSFPEIGHQGLHTHQPDIYRNPHVMSMNYDLSRPADPYSRVLSNGQLMPPHALAYNNSNAQFTISQQIDQNQHQLVHYIGNRTGEMGYSVLNPVNTLMDQSTHHQMATSKSMTQAPITIHPKKRKNSVPLLIPWHQAAYQPRGQLLSMSRAENMWANASNRLPERDVEEIHTGSMSRAKRRLRLTTQLMQQLIPSIPSVLFQGSKPVENECAMYLLARSALAEACGLVTSAEKEAESGQKSTENKTITQPRTWLAARDPMMLKMVEEKLKERIKNLDKDITRLDCSRSALDLKDKAYDLEKLSTVNRLAKHYGVSFLEFSENLFTDNPQDHSPGLRKLPPQKYVIAVPMPRTLPEGVRCLSL